MAIQKRLIRRVVIDIWCLILAVLPYFLTEWGTIPPVTRGFFCDDENIRYPYKDSTISTAANTVFSISADLGVILLVEAIHVHIAKIKKRPLVRVEIDGAKVHPFFVNTYKATMAFLMGAAVQQTITNILKVTVGRLRPHFLSVCQPDWSTIICTDPTSGFPVYVEGATCTGTVQSRISDMRLSFPSGHSSLSTYSMVFAAIYLQARLKWSGSRLLKAFLQAILLYVAAYISVSRISDYKHHWSDVLGGMAIGLIFAIVSAAYVWDYYELISTRKILSDMKGRPVAPSGGDNRYHEEEDATQPASETPLGPANI